jgi:hypothetical protein
MAELLKEAIADAKAVREVALQNAKMALEEAFDSKLKSMLSAKLAEEIEEDVELEEAYDEDEKSEGMSYDEDDKVDEASYDEDDKMDEASDEDLDEDINLDELMAELEEMSYDEDDDMDEGKKDDEDMKEGKKDDEDMNEVDLSGSVEAIGMLPAAISFLTGFVGIPLAAMTAAGFGPIVAAAEKMASLMKKDLSDFKEKAQADPKIQAAAQAIAKKAGQDVSSVAETEMDTTNESFDIDALVAEIESEIEEGKKKDDEVKEAKKKDDEEKEKMKEELEEALSTVSNLQETISEMNLLNSKLLYCNKLFRANALTEAQKVKVVDALDKATTAGEAKLVFETLQESFNFTGVEKRTIKEGLARASKPVGTAPKKVLAESVDETVSRFQKLANINK